MLRAQATREYHQILLPDLQRLSPFRIGRHHITRAVDIAALVQPVVYDLQLDPGTELENCESLDDVLGGNPAQDTLGQVKDAIGLP